MRIHEILFWNKDHAERDRPGSRLDLVPPQFTDDLRNLANAFTKHGVVKYLWNPIRSAEQPDGPAPPGAEPELTPSGTMEPTQASLLARPVEEEPLVGLRRLVPFR